MRGANRAERQAGEPASPHPDLCPRAPHPLPSPASHREGAALRCQVGFGHGPGGLWLFPETSKLCQSSLGICTARWARQRSGPAALTASVGAGGTGAESSGAWGQGGPTGSSANTLRRARARGPHPRLPPGQSRVRGCGSRSRINGKNRAPRPASGGQRITRWLPSKL